jgi:hypothetical protein
MKQIEELKIEISKIEKENVRIKDKLPIYEDATI